MRKKLSVFLVIILVLSLVTGCSSKKETNNGPVTITIWHDKEDDVIQVLQEQFKSLEPDITVKFERKENLTEALKLVGNDPKSAPDMYFFAHDKIGVYAEMGILAPITDFISEEYLKDYIEVTKSSVTYKDDMYQLPIYYETLLFMYNKDMMSESEVPKTTEQLYTYMKNNTSDGKYGFVEQHSTAYYSIPWIHGFDGSLVDEDGNPQLTSPEVIEALKYHQKFVEYMPTEGEYSTVNTLFLEKYAASIIGGPWLVPTAREAGINLGFASMPTVDSTNLPLAPYTGVQGFHVLKVAAETKKDAITTILKELLKPELGVNMAKVSGCAPANEKCYEDESIASDEMIMAMKETAELAKPMPNIPEMDVMWVVTGNLLVAVNMNGGDPETLAQEYQDKAEALIAAMK